ncbi:7454_t:CDS:2 [Funneliformis geosporum]|uniref:17530_t:CDS:1 n=1 Tax=Funneliformis geosporum TaxID=1117311 RepID=A0A9W4SBI1_9GLOM|nr:7454_t:CDS:2 [Funneliformis geosporum]CAI2163749.1 17530_t:CDS:2 [Funneliformis geosporum]
MGCRNCKHLVDDNVVVNNSANNDINTISDRFAIPDEDEETTFSQMIHYVHRFLWQGNYSSPIVERLNAGNARILNVGCGPGPGCWLLNMAREYRWDNFFGVDVNPSVFPTNVSDLNAIFLKLDTLERLPFAAETFDFVFLRFVSFTEEQWQTKVVNELVRVCKRGGWIEIMDCENEFYNRGVTTNRLITACSQFVRLLRETDQIDSIKREEKECFLGNEGGRAGQYLLRDFELNLQSPRVIMSETMGCTNEEYEDLIQEFHNEVKRLNTSIKYVRVYGQKN